MAPSGKEVRFRPRADSAGIRERLGKLWEGGDLLRRLYHGESGPLSLPLSPPGSRELLERFGEVREWVRELEGAASRDGYRLATRTVNHRVLGENRLPVAAVFSSTDEALRLLGRLLEGQGWLHLARRTVRAFPELEEWILAHPLELAGHISDWEGILAVLFWFRTHPRPGRYLRQLDIPGVDTKFIESRKRLLTELLDRILPETAVDRSRAGVRGFEGRFGLLDKPSLVRFRMLDPSRTVGGYSDLTVTAEEFSRNTLPVSRVFLAENDINGLAFPGLADSLVIFGLGYAVDRIFGAAWLQKTEMVYWGDLDTHGFAILDRLRGGFPHVRSFLMDRETLHRHRSLWVTEPEPFTGELLRLTPGERRVFEELKEKIREGKGVRLEQERIPYGEVLEALKD